MATPNRPQPNQPTNRPDHVEKGANLPPPTRPAPPMPLIKPPKQG
ncbi:hypothetical protein [Undibacterium amnicola]|nr:hypothetical protein [Undibacterium amnicola]